MIDGLTSCPHGTGTVTVQKDKMRGRVSTEWPGNRMIDNRFILIKKNNRPPTSVPSLLREERFFILSDICCCLFLMPALNWVKSLISHCAFKSKLRLLEVDSTTCTWFFNLFFPLSLFSSSWNVTLCVAAYLSYFTYICRKACRAQLLLSSSCKIIAIVLSMLNIAPTGFEG